MQRQEKIAQMNRTVMQKMSVFLNYEPNFVKKDMLDELMRECGLSAEEAFSYILAAAVGLDHENDELAREIFTSYFPRMIHRFDVREFLSDPYIQTVHLPSKQVGSWQFLTERYEACEAFACDDLVLDGEGAVLPQIGFFLEPYFCGSVRENGREWMSVNPNEIRTMRAPIARAHGRVLTYGLGLGYFAFMASRKESVSSVTVIERDRNAIRLFEEEIRPQLPTREKIAVVCADAFEYAAHEMKDGSYDFVFADIWHDPTDGVEAYLRFKLTEHLSPKSEFAYWIEPTLRYYL